MWNAWFMGTSLFVTIAIMTVIVAITAGLFARGRNTRTLVAGIGFALLPLGLLLTGMSDLLVSGIESKKARPSSVGVTVGVGFGHKARCAGGGGGFLQLMQVAVTSTLLCITMESQLKSYLGL